MANLQHVDTITKIFVLERLHKDKIPVKDLLTKPDSVRCIAWHKLTDCFMAVPKAALCR